MDLPLFDAFYASVGSGPPSGGPVPPHPGPPSRETRIAAVLVGGLGVPGLLLVLVSIRLLQHSSDDLLAPVIGMVWLTLLGVGLLVVLHAAAGAVQLWRRQQRGRLHAIIVAASLMLIGPFIGVVIGSALGFLLAVGLTGYGASVGWLLMSPGVRADFPGSLLDAATRRSPRRHSGRQWGMSRRG
jgi:hypothetical protein